MITELQSVIRIVSQERFVSDTLSIVVVICPKSGLSRERDIERLY